jgi:hypothetical protein
MYLLQYKTIIFPHFILNMEDHLIIMQKYMKKDKNFLHTYIHKNWRFGRVGGDMVYPYIPETPT